MENTYLEPHKCLYCEKLCYGKQCKECHLKIINEKDGVCRDCKQGFKNATRKNGTKRQRCTPCQLLYNEIYIRSCPKCDNEYRAFSDSGKRYSTCFECYKNSFRKCAKCDNKIKEPYLYCLECYNNKNSLLKKCKTADCTNDTRYVFCESCNENGYKITRLT